MFQQFKNISLNLRSLTDSVGLNEEGWRTRGLERFSAIKNEFQKLDSLLTHRQEDDNKLKPKEPSVVDLEAIGQLLVRFQKNWASIHDNNMDNIEKSKTADHLLLQLLDHCQQHTSVCEQMENSSSELSAMQVDLEAIDAVAVELKKNLITLEKRINIALSENQRREFEAWKIQQEEAFDNKTAETNQSLKEREMLLEQQYQEHNKSQIQKRVELYDVTFQAELDEYRRRRETEVSMLYSQNSPHKETIVSGLDTLKLEESNQADLDDFLGDKSDDSVGNNTAKDNIAKKHAPPTSREDQYTQEMDSSEEEGGVEILGDEDYGE